jgi:hypothetical protein
MEVAIYNDFESRKWKSKRKRGAKCSLETEQNPERPSQRVDEAPAVHPEQKAAESEAVLVKVLRVCPNPRLVECLYQDENGDEKRALVKVLRNGNFTVGMQFKAVRPERETKVWGYAGRLPRFKGRW